MIFKGFDIFRSIRKGSESRATDQGVNLCVIDMINSLTSIAISTSITITMLFSMTIVIAMY